MRSQLQFGGRGTLGKLAPGILLLLAAWVPAQTGPSERSFPQPKAVVEKGLKAMQASLAGRLPVLEGFAKPAEHPLDRYQRAYYQAAVRVSATPSGGSVVHISTKLTAWYSDALASRSGYQLLTSNGRIEADLLDQLAEQLVRDSGSDSATASLPRADAETGSSSETANPASPKLRDSGGFSAPWSQSVAAQERARLRPEPSEGDKVNSSLQAEVEALEAILKNQAHPNNLVAVKKSGTPVVAAPSLTAKPLFLASLHDEFEMLDFNQDWVHVRISGLSRGWIWRNSVEMPEGIPDTDPPAGPAPAPVADLFHVVREEAASFPGDWEPLRGKSVKILSVQKDAEGAKDIGPEQRLAFAKFLFDKNYREMAQKPQELAGIVLIFDSADGGMIAATMSTLQQWKAGILSDSALWHNCFFDPPEILDSAGTPGNR